jgi:myo-inositol-1(or 4)-monophosphatase
MDTGTHAAAAAGPGLVSRAVDIAGRLAGEAAELIVATAGRRADPSTKRSPYDWVTETDRALERRTRRVLATEFPDIPVVGEEFGDDRAGRAAPLRWVVDPVDGTANYVAGLPWCAYSLALVDAHGPLVGVVAHPDRGQVYVAARGRGARANGTALRLPRHTSVKGTLVCTENWPGLGSFASAAARGHAGIRVLGSAALAVTQVALGHASAAVLDHYAEWDVVAALALASEAGAMVLDRRGRECPLPTDGLLVAAPAVAADVLDWWAGT